MIVGLIDVLVDRWFVSRGGVASTEASVAAPHNCGWRWWGYLLERGWWILRMVVLRGRRVRGIILEVVG